ncbi:DUF551 domain-containing protein [Burkholderia cenocepacia]|uniref:hypothetical protein n=1 Tax=Burkholderia cenocepacia TaxID=95486 RepID=UPI00187D4365|nr:hypothetical protein [Burkholderia cenocepacia]
MPDDLKREFEKGRVRLCRSPAMAAEAAVIGDHDLSTSAGGRDYIAEFFTKRLRRHDFGRYIHERLAADFACVLAQYLRDREAAPQPAQADARVGLTDEQREAIEHAVLVAGHCRDGYLGDVLNSILAAHPGQPAPHASAGVIAAARAVIEADRAQTLTTEHVNALDNAIKIQHGKLTLPEPRAEVTGWQPIETAPKETDLLGWRADCGVLLIMYTSFDRWTSEAECEEIDEKTLFQKDWFGTALPGIMDRLEGEQVPTHWMPLPAEPGDAARTGASSC